MQLGTKGIDAKVSGTVGASTGFKMAANSVSFNIMSSNIYNDIIRAPIRELSCNAWDAHNAAGKADAPFEVHIPTPYEPYFSVRDNGTGLKFVKGGCKACKGKGKYTRGKSAGVSCVSCDGTGDYDACKVLYCTYFSSDKNTSNTSIGGFGLGSKSPFAYTNRRLPDGSYKSGGFNVTNRYGGKTYIYSAHVDNGIPSVVLMSVLDTPDEPNGVEVTFAVESDDIWEFENKAKAVFEFFTPEPKFNITLNVSQPTYSVRTALWGMRSDGEGLRAIMGNVQYTVGNIDISRLTEAQKRMMDMDIDLFFNIGELQPAVSREALQLDATTVDAMLKRLDLVQESLMEEVKKQLDTCTTPWEARLKIQFLAMQSGGLGPLVNDALNKGMLFGNYTKFSLQGTKVAVNELDFLNATIVRYTPAGRKGRKADKTNLFSTDLARTIAFRDVADDEKKKGDYDIKFDVDERTAFLVNDIKGVPDRYINYMLNSDGGDSGFGVSNFNKAMVITKANKASSLTRVFDDATVILERIGNPPSFLLSDLKAKYDPLMKEARAEKIRTRQAKVEIRILKDYIKSPRQRSWSSPSTGWTRAWDRGENHTDLYDHSVRKFYIQVEKLGLASRNHGENAYAKEFLSFCNVMRNSGVFPDFTADTPVFGLRDNSPFLLDASFEPLMPYLKAEMAKVLTPAKLLEIEMSLAVNSFSTEWASLLEYIAGHPQVLAHDSAIRQFALTLERAKKVNGEKQDALVSAATKLGFTINNTHDINKAWEKVIKLYPMLKICSLNWRRSGSIGIDDTNVLVDYIRYADDQTKRLSLNLVVSDVQVVATEEAVEEAIEALEEETVDAA